MSAKELGNEPLNQGEHFTHEGDHFCASNGMVAVNLKTGQIVAFLRVIQIPGNKAVWEVYEIRNLKEWFPQSREK